MLNNIDILNELKLDFEKIRNDAINLDILLRKSILINNESMSEELLNEISNNANNFVEIEISKLMNEESI